MKTIRNQNSVQFCAHANTHTHTHTHIYIYIYWEREMFSFINTCFSDWLRSEWPTAMKCTFYFIIIWLTWHSGFRMSLNFYKIYPKRSINIIKIPYNNKEFADLYKVIIYIYIYVCVCVCVWRELSLYLQFNYYQNMRNIAYLSDLHF